MTIDSPTRITNNASLLENVIADIDRHYIPEARNVCFVFGYDNDEIVAFLLTYVKNHSLFMKGQDDYIIRI